MFLEGILRFSALFSHNHNYEQLSDRNLDFASEGEVCHHTTPYHSRTLPHHTCHIIPWWKCVTTPYHTHHTMVGVCHHTTPYHTSPNHTTHYHTLSHSYITIPCLTISYRSEIVSPYHTIGHHTIPWWKCVTLWNQIFYFATSRNFSTHQQLPTAFMHTT